MREKSTDLSGGNVVSIDDRNTIIVVLRGRQTGEIALKLIKDIESATEKLKRQAIKNIHLVIDVSSLKFSDIAVPGQIELRKISELRIDALAVVGSSFFSPITRYILFVSKNKFRKKYFSTMTGATSWLHSLLETEIPRSPVSLITGLFMSLVGVAALIGWQTGNPYLQNVIVELRPINPIEAIGAIIGGYGFIGYWQRKYFLMRLSGFACAVLGLIMLLPFETIDYLLYAEEVKRLGVHAAMSDSTGLGFLGMGIVALVATRKERWVQPIEYAASALVASIALINIYGQMYAYNYLYSISDTFVMSFNLAVALLASTIGGAFLVVFRKRGNVFLNISTMSWAILAVLLFLQVGTYLLWSEAVSRNKEDSLASFNQEVVSIHNFLETETDRYTDILNGYKGLFSASNEVSRKDFLNYFDALKIEDVSGMRSVAYISQVDNSRIAAFTQIQNRQNKLDGLTPFTIKNLTSANTHYIATYATGSQTNATIGRDLASIPGRTEIYSNALHSDTHYVSGLIEFAPASSKDTSQKGFFITVPVKTIGQAVSTSLVNINFNSAQFFPDLFRRSHVAKDVNIAVSMSKNEQPVYVKKNFSETPTLRREVSIDMANSSWQLKVEAPENYSLNESQVRLPLVVLISGQLFTLVLAGVFIIQNRARSKSLELVDMATRDLQHERNYVLDLHKKDEAIISGIADGLIVVDRNARVQMINQAGRDILGLTNDDRLGVSFDKLIVAKDEKGKDIPSSRRPIELALKQRKTISKTLYYVHKTGRMFPVQFKVSPIIQHDEVIGAIEIFRDVTKDFELDKVKSEFVALASHQLRTPLSAVNWFSEMLLDGDAGVLNKDQAEYVTEIHDGNKRMMRLIGDLLDVSRLDLGKFVNLPTEVSIEEIISSIQKEVASDIMTKNITFATHINPRTPHVYADEKLLRMIVQNIISNAIKYTPNKGAVEVTLRRASKEDFAYTHKKYSEDFVLFSVKDTGYGIPKIQQDKVFQKLFRADNVQRLDVEGTGLGLYLVKEVTEKLGGFIWFESIESLGTTFYVVLPLLTTKTKTT